MAYSLSRIAEVSFGAGFVDYPVDDLHQAERRAGEAKQEYEYVSRLVKTEMARFERERIEDFKETLKTFLEGMISRQKEVSVHPSRTTKHHLMVDTHSWFQVGRVINNRCSNALGMEMLPFVLLLLIRSWNLLQYTMIHYHSQIPNKAVRRTYGECQDTWFIPSIEGPYYHLHHLLPGNRMVDLASGSVCDCSKASAGRPNLD